MLLRLPKDNLLTTTTTTIILMVVVQNVFCKPQDSSVFENGASQSLSVAGNMAEMVGNAGMLNKKMGIDMHFAKVNSETTFGTMANGEDDDDSSEEDRRKRSIDLRVVESALKGEEFLLALPFNHHHLPRSKRSPCHHSGGGGTGGGGGVTEIPAGGDDADIAERRRLAYARRRKAAARRRAKTYKKKLTNDDDNANHELNRRRRQSEVDDLNQNMTNADNEFSQHAQQIAEKLRQVWESFMNSMNDMAQRFKQHLSGQNSTNPMEI